MRHLLDWHLLSDDLWHDRIAAAVRYAKAPSRWSETARHRALGLLFFNNSIRTRTSMELAAVQMGAHATTLNVGQGTWGLEFRDNVVMDGEAAEHVKEAIGVLGRYYDALGVRVFAGGKDYAADKADTALHAIARASSVPVVNLESAWFHPCQALGDAATLVDHFKGDVRGKTFVLTWAYHPRALPMAVPNSALLMAARSGMHVRLAHPAPFGLDADLVATAQRYVDENGMTLEVFDDQAAACAGADVIYAKAWGGRPAYDEADGGAALRAAYRDWRVTADHLASTNDGVFMHCLPVRRGVVVDDAVLDGPHTIHLLQAEYRLHAQKAILEWMLGLAG